MALILRDARLIDWRTNAIQHGHFQIDEGPDGRVTPIAEVPAGPPVIDCNGRFVTRAFAVAHHHLYSALARGMPGPSRAPKSFTEILELIWWNLDRQLDREMIRACALVGAVEAVRSGVSFIIDHHASPFAIDGCLETLAEALEEVGVGHLLCYELSDRDGLEVRKKGLAETEGWLRRQPGLVGLHASFTVSDALLEAAVDLARRFDTGLHIHVAEATDDQQHCLEHYGMRVVERLAAAGGLEHPATLLAHGLHLDDRERSLIAASPVWVVQNAESNLNNAVGRFDPRGLGERILIGTDGMHGDALASARAAMLTGQPGVSPGEAYRRLRNVHHYLEASKVPGHGENDLIILDYDPPTPVHAGNWAGHLFYGLDRSHLDTVIRAGRVIMRGREIVTVDEARVMALAREQAQRLWSRL